MQIWEMLSDESNSDVPTPAATPALIRTIFGYANARSLKIGSVIIILWLFLTFCKLVLGVNLLAFAIQHQIGLQARQNADSVNDFGRSAIGESRSEQVRHLRSLRIQLNFARHMRKSSKVIWIIRKTIPHCLLLANQAITLLQNRRGARRYHLRMYKGTI